MYRYIYTLYMLSHSWYACACLRQWVLPPIWPLNTLQRIVSNPCSTTFRAFCHQCSITLCWETEKINLFASFRASFGPSETQSICIPKQHASRPENNCTNIYAVTYMPALHMYKIYDESIMINLLETPTCMVHHLYIFACFPHASCVSTRRKAKNLDTDEIGTEKVLYCPDICHFIYDVGG